MTRNLLTAFATTLLLLTAPGSPAVAESRRVAPSPDAICPILVGSPLPVITLQTLDGKSFDLNRAVAEKPTVLIYFRGGW